MSLTARQPNTRTCSFTVLGKETAIEFPPFTGEVDVTIIDAFTYILLAEFFVFSIISCGRFVTVTCKAMYHIGNKSDCEHAFLPPSVDVIIALLHRHV